MWCAHSRLVVHMQKPGQTFRSSDDGPPSASAKAEPTASAWAMAVACQANRSSALTLACTGRSLSGKTGPATDCKAF